MEKRLLNAADLAVHTSYLVSYAMRSLHDRDLAQDLVQDTMVAALSSQSAYAGRSTLRTWLVGILKHKILDAFRERSRAPASLDLMEEDGVAPAIDDAAPMSGHSGFGLDPAQALENSRFWQAFERELSRMPARMAQVFLLTELSGMDADAVCAKLGMTPNALWVMRFRAKDALRAGLSAGFAA